MHIIWLQKPFDLFIDFSTTFKNFGTLADAYSSLGLSQALTCYASLAQAQEKLWTWRRPTVLYTNTKTRMYSEASVIRDFCIMDP